MKDWEQSIDIPKGNLLFSSASKVGDLLFSKDVVNREVTLVLCASWFSIRLGKKKRPM